MVSAGHAAHVPTRLVARRRGATAVALWAILTCFGSALAADEAPSEQSLRAAMVFNFLKFTEFPPEPASPRTMRLCLAVGDAQQAAALAALTGRKVWNRELVVTPLAGRNDECDVLYVDSRQRWNATEERRAQHRALTIAAYAGFARDGGIIEIAVQDNGARFEVNVNEGRRAGFRFAPQLLRLARKLYE